jgi:hypothetical protein
MTGNLDLNPLGTITLPGGAVIPSGETEKFLREDGTLQSVLAGAGDAGPAYGSGTAYTLTTSMANVAFGTSGALSVVIPSAGAYLILAEVREDLSAIAASAAANYSLYGLYDGSSILNNSERIGHTIPILAAAIAGINGGTLAFMWLYQATGPITLTLQAKQSGATTGAWNIVSETGGLTTLRYLAITDTIHGAVHVYIQSHAAGNDNLDASVSRIAWKQTIAGKVTSLQAYLEKSGSPVNVVTARVRKVSDGSIIDTSTNTVDSAGLTGSWVLHTFTFPGVFASEAVYISLERAVETGEVRIGISNDTPINQESYYSTAAWHDRSGYAFSGILAIEEA